MKKRILVPVDNTPVTQDVIKVADFWGQKLDAKLLFRIAGALGQPPGFRPLTRPRLAKCKRVPTPRRTPPAHA